MLIITLKMMRITKIMIYFSFLGCVDDGNGHCHCDDVFQLLGEWYDVGRTTYIWGQGTWTSQQWNFVQGRDGTMVALFNGMW